MRGRGGREGGEGGSKGREGGREGTNTSIECMYSKIPSSLSSESNVVD